MNLNLIRTLLIASFIQIFVNSFSQDTSKIIQHVKFPEMEAQLTLTFSASDFNLVEELKIKDLTEIERLKKQLKGNEKDAEIYDEMNSIYSYFKRNQEANEAFKKSKDLFMQQLSAAPEDTSIIRKMGDLFYGNSQMNMALLYFDAVYKVDTTNASIIEKLALCNFFLGSNEKAYSFVNKALELEPDNMSFYCTLTLMNLMTRIRELSLMPEDEFEKVGFKNFFDYAYLEEGAKKNPKDDRFELFIKSMQLTAIMYKSIFDIAGQATDGSTKITFNHNDEEKEKLEEIKKSLLKFTKVKNPIFAYKNLMIAEFLMGNLEQAIKYFEEIKTINPYYDEAYNNMMAMYIMQEDYDNSIKVVKEIAESKPTYGYYLLLSRLYYEKTDYENALVFANKAKDLNQQSAESYLAMVAIYLKSGKFLEACQVSYDLAKYLPNEPLVVYNVALCEMINGNIENSKEYLRQLVEVGLYVDSINSLLSE